MNPRAKKFGLFRRTTQSILGVAWPRRSGDGDPLPAVPSGKEPGSGASDGSAGSTTFFHPYLGDASLFVRKHDK